MPDLASRLFARLQSREARVGVVGLGYVGLPLAVEFARGGLTTVGIDLDTQKIAAIERGESYIPDVPAADVRDLVAARRLSATTDFALSQTLDTINICVPTPLRKTKDPDMSYIVSAVEAIAAHLRPGMLVILESTTYPGTTEEARAADPRDARPAKSARTSSWRSRPSASIRATATTRPGTCPRSSAASTPDLHRSGAVLYGAAIDDRGAGQLAARGRDGEAAGEHLPRRQHRPRQRDGADVRQAGHRRVGSDRRRRPPSRSASCRSIRARASAGTASRSIRSTCPGR